MNFIKFAQAKKAPKRLLRPARLDNLATKEIQNSMHTAVTRKASIWESEGVTQGGLNKKMNAFQEKVIAKRKAITEKNKLYLANKKIDKTVDNFNRAVSAPTNVVNPPTGNNVEAILKKDPNFFKDTTTPQQIHASQTSKSKVISPKGSGKGLLIGAGVATGAVVLGGLGYGLYRKMRSDKGKKRGIYKNFNFSGELVDFSRKTIKDPNTFFQKVSRKNKKIKDPNNFFKKLGKKYT